MLLFKSLNLWVIALLLTLTACGGGSSGDESDASDDDTTQIVDAAISDMSGDGRPDIALEIQLNSSTLPWHFGITEAGRFNVVGALSHAVDLGIYDKGKAIAVADANGDGLNDLLVRRDAVDGFSYWDVLISNGEDSKQAIGNIALPRGDDARALAFTDIDGDGYADILFQQQISGFTTYYLAMGDGDGFSSLQAVYSFDISLGLPEIIAVEDINGDGTADLIYDLQLDGSHCFVVRIFRDGAFERQAFNTECWAGRSNSSTLQIIPPALPGAFPLEESTIETTNGVGVADLDGDGQSELIFSETYTRLAYFFDTATGATSRGSFTYDHTFYALSLRQGSSGTEWTSVETLFATGDGSIATGGVESLAVQDLVEPSSISTVAIVDMNNDGRVDFLNELSSLGRKSWLVNLAQPDGTYLQQTFLRGPDTDVTIGVRDYNGDNLPDLLLNAPGTRSSALTHLFVALNDGTQFDPNGFLPWYTTPSISQVIGLEEDGLTSTAKDANALISWSNLGGSPRYTQNEFRTLLEGKGKRLIADGETLANNGDCQIVYPSVDTQDLSSEFGSVVCKVELIDGVELEFQPIYGGCRATRNDFRPGGFGGGCEIGIVAVELELKLPGGATQTIAAKGPNAGACSAISSDFACINAHATLVSVSQALTLNGTGAGVGASVGVGLDADLGIKDGVISAEIGGALGVGVSVKFSLNYEASGEFFVENGSAAFVYVGDNVSDGVIAAGSALVDSGYIVGAVLETTPGAAISVVSETAEGAGDVFLEGVNTLGNAAEDLWCSIFC